MKEKTSTILKFEIVGAIFLHTLCRLNIEISNKNLFFLLSFVSMITICLVFPSAWNDATYLRRFGRREEDHLQFPRYFASPRLPCPRCWWMLRIFPPFLSKPASIHGPLRIGAVTLQRVRLNSLKLRVSPPHAQSGLGSFSSALKSTLLESTLLSRMGSTLLMWLRSIQY